MLNYGFVAAMITTAPDADASSWAVGALAGAQQRRDQVVISQLNPATPLTLCHSHA